MLENEIIKLIKNTFECQNKPYIGDDCAFLPDLGLVISTDSMVEDVHFRNFYNPVSLGWKIAAVNFSDIASMGVKPQYLLLSVSIPPLYPDQWIEDFFQGVRDCCQVYNVHLVGGDLTSSEKIYLSGTALISLSQIIMLN